MSAYPSFVEAVGCLLVMLVVFFAFPRLLDFPLVSGRRKG
jgi:hypothetical protein